MPMQDDEDEEPFAPVATLDRDGKINGLIVPRDQRKPPEVWTQPEAPLELDHRPAPEEPEPPPPPRDNSGRNAIVLVVAILFATAGVVFFIARSKSPLAGAEMPEEKVSPPSDTAVENGARSLAIESDPAGAKVIVDGEDVGTTPFLGSNNVAPGKDAEVRVELPGYKPWVGVLKGGTNGRLRAKLKRR
jgi:hypothetical protein